MPGTLLIGREDELDLVETFLGGVAEGPCALVLSGEAGIDETALAEATGDVEERARHLALAADGPKRIGGRRAGLAARHAETVEA